MIIKIIKEEEYNYLFNKNILSDLMIYIENDEEGFINSKLLELQNFINIIPIRNTKEGNISMNEHLSNVKNNIELNTPSFINNIKENVLLRIDDFIELESKTNLEKI